MKKIKELSVKFLNILITIDVIFAVSIEIIPIIIYCTLRWLEGKIKYQ